MEKKLGPKQSRLGIKMMDVFLRLRSNIDVSDKPALFRAPFSSKLLQRLILVWWDIWLQPLKRPRCLYFLPYPVVLRAFNYHLARSAVVCSFVQNAIGVTSAPWYIQLHSFICYLMRVLFTLYTKGLH